jgi:predicted RNA-binding Zn-ribbon protein involved in translation (DUF1610 family)
MDSNTVKIRGKQLRCQHCGGQRFVNQQFEIERAFGTTWIWMHLWGKLANVYICERCGHLHWFFSAKDAEHEVEPAAPVVEVPEPAEAVKCLSCGETIPAGSDKCAACGWTWKAEVETPA